MASVIENLQKIEETKARLKVAIESKGQDLTNVPFTQYPEKVAEIRPNVISKEIVENGTYNAEDDGVEGYSSVNVNVPVPDLSSTTATSEDVFQGKQFYNAQGELVAGTYKDMMQRKIDWSKDCGSLFYNCPDEDMSWVRNLDTSGVTKMGNMFDRCGNATVIDVSNFKTDNVTTMSNMFNRCNKLIGVNISNWNTGNVTNTQYMFSGCNKITLIPALDTRKVTKMASMFGNGCYALTTVELLDMRSVTTASSTSYMFDRCSKLINLTLRNIRVDLNLESCKLLSNESLINTIQELWDLTGNTIQTLTLSTESKSNISNIYVKLIDVTDEMRAEDEYIDNKKPCEVCESTDAGAMTLTEYAMSKNWAIA